MLRSSYQASLCFPESTPHEIPEAVTGFYEGHSMLSTEKGYRRLFFVAALYNLVLGFIHLVFYSWVATVFDMPAQIREPDVFSQMAILLAMVFGVGYYMVSRDLYGRMGIVHLGIIGKGVVFFLFFYHFMFAGLPVPVFLIGVGDLLFALLFLKFVLFAQERPRHVSP
jgi:hypothetical protein